MILFLIIFSAALFFLFDQPLAAPPLSCVEDIQAKLMQGLTKERNDWRKWRQSGGKYKSLINGVRR